MNQNELEKRLTKGIDYFRGVDPSEWNATKTNHLHLFLDLVEMYLVANITKKLESQEDRVEALNQIFNETEQQKL